jgi:putative oxidoreductase
MMWHDAEKLALRLAAGSLIAGHGAQKLFGAFEGPGLAGMAGTMEKMGLQPGRPWALAAALAEFGGGSLTALGLLSPLGPIGMLSAMGMATAKVHWGKPIWASKGGAELPAIYAASALALSISGPGQYSLDHALGIQIPRWFAIAAASAAAGILTYGIVAPQLAAKAQPVPDTQAGSVAAERLATG